MLATQWEHNRICDTCEIGTVKWRRRKNKSVIGYYISRKTGEYIEIIRHPNNCNNDVGYSLPSIRNTVLKSPIPYYDWSSIHLFGWSRVFVMLNRLALWMNATADVAVILTNIIFFARTVLPLAVFSNWVFELFNFLIILNLFIRRKFYQDDTV